MRAKIPAAVACVVALGGCVSVEEAPPARAAIRPGERALLVVYASPAPWVTTAEDTKVESAAKALPGLADMVQTAQDSRDLAQSERLRPYLPRWRGDELFAPYLMRELEAAAFPAVWLSSGAATLGAERTRRFNRAKDALEWRTRYFLSDTAGMRPWRDYSAVLELADGLVLEANLQHGLAGLEEGSYAPSLSIRSRLYRAGTMRLLWSHESSLQDPNNARALADHMGAAGALSMSLEAMMPELARKAAASLASTVTAAKPASGALGTPMERALRLPAVSTTTASEPPAPSTGPAGAPPAEPASP